MIIIANKTREIEKNNNNLKKHITKISEEIKINEIELSIHQNSTYLKKLYSLYFSKINKNKNPNVISIKQISINKKNLKLVNKTDK